MLVLGIETSCDDTSIAVVSDQKKILSNITSTSLDHRFSGVVPEIAARAHLETIGHVYQQAIDAAGVQLCDITAVAATTGPGLIGGLLVGVMFAKGLAMSSGIPFVAVNHLRAHAMTVRMFCDLNFPYLLMLASGGHCILAIARDIDVFEVIGRTVDDSAGESLDKIARMLSLEEFNGQCIERHALCGDRYSVELPRPMCTKNDGLLFSFSGLKTAVSMLDQTMYNREDICASVERCIADVLCYKITAALKLFPEVKNVVLAGGVAANQYLRSRLDEICALYTPPVQYCTDNGAMVAWCGVESLMKYGVVDHLEAQASPNIPLCASALHFL